jgi:hypothetical protein
MNISTIKNAFGEYGEIHSGLLNKNLSPNTPNEDESIRRGCLRKAP